MQTSIPFRPARSEDLPLRTLVFGLLLLTASVASAQQPAARPVTPLTALDLLEIQQLLNKYAFALDTCSNNGYDYADLYTPDGIFYWGVGGRKSVGREQLAEAAGGGKQGCRKLQTASRENPIQTHMTVNVVIEAAIASRPSSNSSEGRKCGERPGKRDFCELTANSPG